VLHNTNISRPQSNLESTKAVGKVLIPLRSYLERRYYMRYFLYSRCLFGNLKFLWMGLLQKFNCDVLFTLWLLQLDE
jgi:hypothetical protein